MKTPKTLTSEFSIFQSSSKKKAKKIKIEENSLRNYRIYPGSHRKHRNISGSRKNDSEHYPSSFGSKD